MEFERDKQTVFKQTENAQFKPWYLQALEYRLARFQTHNETKLQRNWFDTKVLPRIGATARTGQRKSEKSTRGDEQKFALTAGGVDYAIDLVAKGSSEDLINLVADPEHFIENRKETVVVVLDETALWLKCRGEEQVYQSAIEILNAAKRRSVRKAAKKAESSVEKEAIQEEFKAWAEQNVENRDDRDMISQWYHSGGDKHRLTLVNISDVKNWFDPAREVKWGKDVLVLLVFCTEHVRAEDIGDDHKFNKRVVIETNEGPIIHEQGEFTRMLWPYIEWRKQGTNAEDYKEIRIWGQPSAWVDTQVNIWLADLLHETYKQALLLTDCLLSRWSELSLLAFWGNQIILVPYAPDSGAFLQEPDTHEHAPLKADIRFTKAELQFDLEEEAKQKNKKGVKIKWGPHEYLHILSKGVERFKSRNPLVPIQGMVSNHMLATRPTVAEDGTVQVKLLEDCSEISTKNLLDIPGIARYPASKGLSDNWCKLRDARVRGWPGNKPPKPDWDQYADEAMLVQDDLPVAPEAGELVLDLDDFNDLELSDHQKVMLLPVDTRVNQIVYPASIQARVQSMSLEGLKKKSKWVSKFNGHFAGKLAAKWKQKVNEATGIKKSVQNIMDKMGPAVYIKKKKKMGRARPSKFKTPGRTGPAVGSKCKQAKPSSVSQLKKEERIENHADVSKHVMVTQEVAGENLRGRRGTVTSVFKITEADGREWLKYVIIEDKTKANQFFVDSTFCEDISLVGTTEPLGIQVDWRQLRGDRLESIIGILAARTAPANLEIVVPGTLVEHSTIKAGLIELKERFQPFNVKFFSPQECVMLGCSYI